MNSRVRDLVREMTGQEPLSFQRLPKKQVACRLEPDGFALLQVVASDLGMTPTGCAEKLLEAAIEEAYEELRGPCDPDNDNDVQRLLNQQLRDHLKAHGFTVEDEVPPVEVMSEGDKQAFLEAAKEPVKKGGK